MPAARRRLLLDDAVVVVVALLVVLVAFGSSSLATASRIGGPGRWVALFALLAVSAALVVRDRPSVVRPSWFVVAAGLFAGLAFVSTSWSVAPRLTLERAGSFAVLLLAAALLGLATARNATLSRRLVVALVAAATTLALAGIVVYIGWPHLAVQGSTLTSGARFRGFGQNPNTLSMLYAVAIPAAVWLAVTARARSRQAVLAAAALLLLGSISASGSRGALVGVIPAVVLVVAATLRGRALLLGLAVTAVAVAVAVVGTTAAKPDRSPAPTPAEPASAVTAPAPTTDAATVLRRLSTPAPVLSSDPNELGRPRPGLTGGSYRRTLFGSSGRAQAWDGALRQSLQRPLLGYGFGTEERVFIDRFYVFEGTRIENSYIGLWLQVGLAGLLAFLVAVAFLLVRFVSALRSMAGERGVFIACGGIVVSGFLMAVAQSYIYSVGNVATATVWIAAFMLGTTASEAGRR